MNCAHHLPSSLCIRTAILCAASLAASAAAQCPVSFAPSVPTNGGPFQWEMVTGDFNDDGRPDLAFARALTNQVAVQLAAETPGTFLPPVTYAVGSSPVSIGVGDFNGDGHLDLVTANLQSNSVSWLPGIGGPTGAFRDAIPLAVGNRPSLIVVSDFNGDGRSDFAVPNDETTQISVRLADAAGGFAPATSYTVGNFPYGAAAADFTGDGLIDLAFILLDTGNIKLLRNTGGGAFTLAGTYTAGSSLWFARAADVDLDSKQDLLVTDQNGGVYVLLGNATPTMTFQTAVRYPAIGGAYYIAVGDLNLDARPDVIVTSFGLHMAAVLTGNGTTAATFGAPVLYSVGGNPNGVAIADFNADGRPDAVVSAQGGAANTSRLLANNGPVLPSFTQHPSDASSCPTGAAPFSVVASPAGSYTYQWQIETSPGSWITLGNDPGPLPGGGFAFATPLNSPSVSIGVRSRSGDFNVRCIAANTCGSVPSSPATLTVCAADFNCDELVDPDDLADFITCFFLDVQFPGTCAAADFNGDGFRDPDDLAEFITVFFGPGC